MGFVEKLQFFYFLKSLSTHNASNKYLTSDHPFFSEVSFHKSVEKSMQDNHSLDGHHHQSQKYNVLRASLGHAKGQLEPAVLREIMERWREVRTYTLLPLSGLAKNISGIDIGDTDNIMAWSAIMKAWN